MRLFKIVLLCILICKEANSLYAQPIKSEATKYQSIQKSGMVILGGWALGNAVYSIPIAVYYKDNTFNHNFALMNIGWSTVNFGIATIGLLGNLKAPNSDDEVMPLIRKNQKIYLINSGLDIMYLTAGLYMSERGYYLNNPQLQGFGTSILLQGGFLAMFDLYQYFRLHKLKKSILKSSTFSLDTSYSRGISLTLHF
jgi:hypothetical protein